MRTTAGDRIHHADTVWVWSLLRGEEGKREGGRERERAEERRERREAEAETCLPQWEERDLEWAERVS